MYLNRIIRAHFVTRAASYAKLLIKNYCRISLVIVLSGKADGFFRTYHHAIVTSLTASRIIINFLHTIFSLLVHMYTIHVAEYVFCFTGTLKICTRAVQRNCDTEHPISLPILNWEYSTARQLCKWIFFLKTLNNAFLHTCIHILNFAVMPI